MIIKTMLATTIAFMLSATIVFSDKPIAMTEQTVFQRGVDGYKNIRIPTICRTTHNTLLAFAEGRVGGDAGKIETILKRSTDGGQTWGKLQVVWRDNENTCGNPTPIVDYKTGTIWLFMTWNLGTDREKDITNGKSKYPRKVYLCKSTDDGNTWSTPIEMPHLRKSSWRWYATGPVNGIQLTRGEHKGRLICPANHSKKGDGKHDTKTYHSHIIYSDDHGKTWRLGGEHESWTNESTVVELSDGSVMQNMRSYHKKGNRAVAISKDGGEHFEKLYLDDALESPVCQGSILRVNWQEEGKNTIAFSCPAGPGRTNMTVHISHDDGNTWATHTKIYDGSGAYSNLVKVSEHELGLLYEKDKYAKIVFITMPLVALK